MQKCKLILVRHGQSEWNLLNKFTGWNDVNLSNQGKIEAKKSAELILKNKIEFSYGFTSFLKRAIHTLWIILKETEKMWIPVKKTWKLNERHYGTLQGMNKDEIIKKYGESKVFSWRRSYEKIPPRVTLLDHRFPGNDPRYKDIGLKNLPTGESLELTEKRVVCFWKEYIFPKIKFGKNVLIVAHGNSLRALLKYLGKIDKSSIQNIDIPTGCPIVYEFTKKNLPSRYYYL